MSDQMKTALMQGQQAGVTIQRPNGMGMLAQGTDPQGLPPTVARMQGGYGLSPQMIGLLSQAAGQQKMAAPQVKSPFTMQPQQDLARLGMGQNFWVR